MINLHTAFASTGFSISDIVGIFGGEEDPRLINSSDAPIGSLYLQTSGDTWKRFGADAADWSKMASQDIPLDVHLRDPITGAGAKVNNAGAVFVYESQLVIPPSGTPNRHRVLTGLLGTNGLNAGTTNLRVDGYASNVDAYVSANQNYDIHITGISFLIADSAVVHNRFGNVPGLTQGIDVFFIDNSETEYLIKNATTGGKIIAQSGGTHLFGSDNEVNEVTNWAGNSDAQLIFFDIGSMCHPDGLRIGRGTQDKLVVRIRDDLSQIHSSGEFSVRIFGFKKYS